MNFGKLRAAMLLLAMTTGGAFAQTPAADERPPPPQVTLGGTGFELHLKDAYPSYTAGISKPKPALDMETLGKVLGAAYPTASRRANETGDTFLFMCVDAKGWAQDIHVVRSSGFERLDQASLIFMQSLPLKPAQLDGKPVAYCGYRFIVTWSLTDPPAE